MQSVHIMYKLLNKLPESGSVKFNRPVMMAGNPDAQR
jgi:hypothetical protein